MSTTCNFCWGTHGCDLTPGHEGTVHKCGGWLERAGSIDCEDLPCSEYDEANGRARYFDDVPGSWSVWMENGRGFHAVRA